jgi:archaellum component FlaC
MNRIISTILIVALITPLIAGLLEIPIALAQLQPVKITNIYVYDTDGVLKPITQTGIEDVVNGGIWPAEPIIVEVSVGLQVPFKIVVTDPVEMYTYLEQSVPPMTPGSYNITVYVPDKFANLIGQVIFKVEPGFGDPYYYPGTYAVYPKLVVNPKVTTLVDELGTPLPVSFTVYGVPSYNSLKEIRIGGVCLISVTDGAPDAYAVVSKTYTLLTVCGHSIPADTYTVSFILADNTYLSKYKVDTLTIRPMVYFERKSGHGMWVDDSLLSPGLIGDPEINDAKNIIIRGVGFPANVKIASITLVNKNYTGLGVSYKVDFFLQGIDVPTGAFGEFRVTLDVKSNMTAGLYYPVVVYFDPVTSKYSDPISFINTYYLVRPILLFLYNGLLYKEYPVVLYPGDNITIVAFGYGPGKDWTTNSVKLYIYIDTQLLTEVELEKNGHAVTTTTLPHDLTYGSHYIKGIDDWKYEYTVAVVIGGRAVFTVINPITKKPTDVNKVTASWYGKILTVCPCETVLGCSYCNKTVVYNGECDYLGDYVKVMIYGLTPGEKLVKVYLGGAELPADLIVDAKPADANGRMEFTFIVPTIPQGTYTITVVTETQTIQVVWAYNASINYIEVVPKILLLPLSEEPYIPVLVGSGVVRVIGTGFPQGVLFYKALLNDTDALEALTTQVTKWSTDESGVVIGGKIKDLVIKPALLIPMIEPGKYSIRLVYYVGTTLDYSLPGYVYVVNNISKIPSVDDITSAIREGLDNVRTTLNTLSQTLGGKVDQVLSVVNDIKDNLGKLNDIVSRLDSISSNLASASDKITNAANKIDTISGQLQTVTSALDDVKKGIDGLKTDVGNVKTSVDAVKTSVDNVASSVNSVGGKVDDVSKKVDSIGGTASSAMYIGIVATIFALLATLFALLAYTTIKKSVAPK